MSLILFIVTCSQVKFSMSEETNLSDLLALNLHNFEEEVRNIVDKATKELSMEKTLKVSTHENYHAVASLDLCCRPILVYSVT